MNRRTVKSNGLSIRNLRNQRGWTQRDLARRAGYTERLIRKAESGGALDIQTAMDIAEALSQDLRKVFVDEFFAARDRLTIAKNFLDAFALYGRDMVAYVKHDLTIDFRVRLAAFSRSSTCYLDDWFGLNGLHLLLDRIVRDFSMDEGVADQAYTEGVDLVSARYRQKLWFAGHALEPFWVNLHFRFESDRISTLEVDYDTFAVSRIFSNLQRDESQPYESSSS